MLLYEALALLYEALVLLCKALVLLYEELVPICESQVPPIMIKCLHLSQQCLFMPVKDCLRLLCRKNLFSALLMHIFSKTCGGRHIRCDSLGGATFLLTTPLINSPGILNRKTIIFSSCHALTTTVYIKVVQIEIQEALG